MKIPQPDRSLGILRLKKAPSLPASEKLARYISSAVEDMRNVILRYETRSSGEHRPVAGLLLPHQPFKHVFLSAQRARSRLSP